MKSYFEILEKEKIMKTNGYLALESEREENQWRKKKWKYNEENNNENIMYHVEEENEMK